MKINESNHTFSILQIAGSVSTPQEMEEKKEDTHVSNNSVLYVATVCPTCIIICILFYSFNV